MAIGNAELMHECPLYTPAHGNSQYAIHPGKLFDQASGKVELMDECSSKHFRMGTASIKYVKEMIRPGYRKCGTHARVFL